MGKNVENSIAEGYRPEKKAGLVQSFIRGDIWTKLSALIMGLGCFARAQIARGLIFLTFQGLFIWYMITRGVYWISMLPSLGLVGPTKEYDSFFDTYVVTYNDNSFKILLYGILTLFLIASFIFTWALNIKASYDAQLKDEQGKKVNKLMDDLRELLDEKFYKTLLTLPAIGITVFTFLPMVFTILIAFTNYDGTHDGYITNLFNWVGFENFRTMFSRSGSTATGSYFSTFMSILGWTLVWAFFATFSNYILGILVALMINKKGIKFKKMWRTILVMTIAIPQFISLLYVSKMFSKSGIVNGFLTNNGFTKSEAVYYIDPDTNIGISVSPEKGQTIDLASDSVASVLSGGDIIIVSPKNDKLRIRYTLKENKTLDSYLSNSEADAFLKEYGLKDNGAFIDERVYKPLIQQPYDFWNEKIEVKLPDWMFGGKKLFSIWTAQLMVILINIWIGIPYLVLIATGILMNIPADLYEASKIDGATPRQQFRYITMPYMLFVTAPYLLTSFTGNINNFNVIYLLTGGGPTNAAASSAAGSVGHTDLLITWLFKITQGTEALYYMASVIGIAIFVIVATLTLTVYNRLGSNKNEGDMA